MRLNKTLIPIGVLALALGAGGFSADAAQQRRGNQRDRNGGESRGQARERSGEPRTGAGAADPQRRSGGDQRTSRDGDGADRGNAPATRGDQRVRPSDPRGNDRARPAGPRGDERVRPSGPRGDERIRPSAPGGGAYRGGNLRGGPRIVPRRPVRQHYYGSGGNFSVYFGWGSGYRYGAPYSGRVYGYSDPSRIYGSRRYYGDVRLLVRPRDAAVYVDGYYAGIVDDFDGVFQRLTIEAGPHQIEVEAPGFEPQVFDVYVDPSRSVDLRGDLYPERW